jgi:hypothetical protein
VCIPFAQEDKIFTTSGLAVRDMVQNALVPVQLIPHTRHGNYGDTNCPLATALLYFRPTLNANETRRFQLEVGTNPKASTVVTADRNTSATDIVVDTGVAEFRIPKRGAQSIIRKCTLKPSGLLLIDSDNGGLVIHGVDSNAGSGNNYPVVAEGQGHDFSSRFDSSGDGTLNHAWATERYTGRPVNGPRVAKWAVETLLSGPEVVVLKLSCVRMKDAIGVAFKGKAAHNNAYYKDAELVQWDVTCDVYLWFFAGTAACVVDVVNKSTGADASHFGRPTADVSCRMFGFDLAPTWSGGGTWITATDEAATSKATQAQVTGSVAIRQRSAPTLDGNLHLTVSYSGFTPAGANTTWGNAVFDSTKSDSSMGLAVMPWNWRNYYPQGVAWDVTSGRLRWELLNPDESDVTRYRGTTPDVYPYHVIPGPHQPRWTAWIYPHAGRLSPAQLVECVKRHAGVAEASSGGVYSAMILPAGKGGQIPSMLGSVDSEIWHHTKAFFPSLCPNSTSALKAAMLAYAPRSTALSSPRALSAVSSATGRYSVAGKTYPVFSNTVRGQDAIDMLERWRLVRIDGVAARSHDPWYGDSADDLVWQATCATNTGVPRIGWRDYPPTATSGGQCGANDYQAHTLLFVSWLLTGERAFWHHAYTSIRHHMAIDLQHTAFPDDDGSFFNQGMNCDWQFAGPRHYGQFWTGLEYQQFMEDFALLFVLTGDYVARESMEWMIDGYGRRWMGERTRTRGEPTEGTLWDRQRLTGRFTAGSNIVRDVADIAKLHPTPYSKWFLEPIVGLTWAAYQGECTLQAVNPDHSVQFSATADGRTNQYTGTSTFYAVPVGSSRALAWPLHALVTIGRALGPDVALHTSYTLGGTRTNPPNNPPRIGSLATWITLNIEKNIYSEQLQASDALKASPMGGSGVTYNTFPEKPPSGFPGGSHYQNETYATYPAVPWREAYIYMKWLRANGWASEVPQTSLDQLLLLIERLIKLLMTGVTGTDWSAYWNPDGSSPWAHKIPWTTGGRVYSDTLAIQLYGQPRGLNLWAGLRTYDDLNAIPTTYGGKYNGNIQGASILAASEVAAWLALEKYHPEGAASQAKRDMALDLSVLAFVSAVLWMGEGSTVTAGGINVWIDPHYTNWPSPWLSKTAPYFTVRNKNWFGNVLTGYSLRLLVDVFLASRNPSAPAK